MRNILVVTGGAGFIGTNLIFKLLEFKKFKIISFDRFLQIHQNEKWNEFYQYNFSIKFRYF